MLVLSRKLGEVIVIGDSIRITVVEIRGGKVRLGVVAPDEVIVNRQEIHEKRLNTLGERDAHAPKPADLAMAKLPFAWPIVVPSIIRDAVPW
jgi:carbon storage regulator